MSLPKLNRNQIVVGIFAASALAIVGGLTWGFGQQLVLARQMRIEEERLEQAVAAAQARHDELMAQLEYVRSDEYVEQWARVEARMARPGEVVVVLSAPASEDPTDDVQPTPTPNSNPRRFWVELWELIFTPAGQ